MKTTLNAGLRLTAIAAGAGMASAAHAEYATSYGNTSPAAAFGFCIMVAVLLLAILAMSMAPAIIAFARHHHYRWAILVLTLLGGWTGIGWIAALIWSCLPANGDLAPTGGLDRIERLARMHEAGQLTDAEYQAAKTEILKRI